MIISRTPLRISFVGGGTDLPAYADRYVGEVISTTINKYVYVTAAHKFDGRVSIRYSETENVATVDELKHTIIRECLKSFGIKDGIEIVTISDVPMKGTGLGSSSALTVGLINALCAYMGVRSDEEDLAESAAYIEISKLNAPIGRQDQYAAAYGGFNHLQFGRGSVTVDELRMPSTCQKVIWLEDNTMLFWLHQERDANDILLEQSEQIDDRLPLYESMKESVHAFLNWADSRNDMPEDAVGGIMNIAWENKKAFCSSITTPHINDLYSRAIDAGAIGGKISGAGGGGFLMLIVPEDAQDSVRDALPEAHEMPFKFTIKGSEVVYES